MNHRPQFRDKMARDNWVAKQMRNPDGLGPAPSADECARMDAHTDQLVRELAALTKLREMRQAASAAIDAMTLAHPNSDATALVQSIRDQLDTLFVSGPRAVSREASATRGCDRYHDDKNEGMG